MNYLYYIEYESDTGTQTIQVNPSFSEVKIASKQQSDQLFFREYIDEKFTFGNDSDYADYDLLMGFESTPQRQINLFIKRVCDNTEYWKGYCNFYDFEIDEDRCLIEVAFTVNDSYRCILENYETEHNILSGISTVVTIDADFAQRSYEYITVDCGTSCFSGINKGTDDCYYGFPLQDGLTGGKPLNFGTCNYAADLWREYSVLYDRIIDLSCPIGQKNFSITATYFRERYYTIDEGGSPVTPPGTGWADTGEVDANGRRKWVRYPLTGTPDNPATGLYWQKYCVTTDAVRYEINNIPAQQVVTYPNGRTFDDVMQFLLDETCSGFTFQSTFIQNVLNPVTSVNPNPLNNLTVFQKSDIRNYDASEVATIGNISLKDILDVLRNLLDVYWRIEGSNFRVEHVSYWKGVIPGYSLSFTVDFNLTTLDDGIHEVASNKYSYDRENMPNREAFRAMEQGNTDFVGYDIVYNSIETNLRGQDNTLRHDLNIVTTDIEFIQLNPGDVSNEGFVFAINGGLQAAGAFAENGVLTGAYYPNAHLSWANVQDNYWRYNRVVLTGELNNTEVTFETARKIKEQTELSFPVCCENFDPEKLITTTMGNGEVVEASESLKTREVTVKLKY